MLDHDCSGGGGTAAWPAGGRSRAWSPHGVTNNVVFEYYENKAKAITAELFELNLKVQLCNLVYD